MPTNIPKPSFSTLTGFIPPPEADILAGAIQDINDAFGGGLNPSLTSPQGQIASSEAAVVGFINDMFVYMTNMFNPAYSEGRWQDGLAYIYFIERKPSTSTVVQATCSGAQDTVIPVGALAIAQDGNIYTCDQQGTIDASGSVVLPFSCNLAGPVECPSGTLDTIYQTILGWDTIDNLADGVVGQEVESRREFEARRFASVAQNSVGALHAIQGSVLSVPGVLDAYVTENPTAAPVTTGGYTLAARSLYVAAVGGEAADIAEAIWKKKAPGCAYNGNTTVTVYDKNYDPPYPSYEVKFETPDPTPILYKVTLADNAQIPADGTALVKAAIQAAFNGLDGGTRARIGSIIYASRYYSAVATLGAWAQIIAIDVGSQNTSAADCDAGFIAGTAFTEAGTTTGTFAIGQTIIGDGVLPGTIILSGTSPNWVVNLTQTVSARTLYGALADQNKVQVQIDQSPTLSDDDIEVEVM
jgi:uncharacterized phage protein gp47/JayE